MGILTTALVVTGIVFIILIIILIDSIIEKYFYNMVKYRIVEIKEELCTTYIIQRRFLWFFWINAFDDPTKFSSLEIAKHAIKGLKFKIKKEVVYEE